MEFTSTCMTSLHLHCLIRGLFSNHIHTGDGLQPTNQQGTIQSLRDGLWWGLQARHGFQSNSRNHRDDFIIFWEPRVPPICTWSYQCPHSSQRESLLIARYYLTILLTKYFKDSTLLFIVGIFCHLMVFL
jgi:hypothetical protein